MKQRVKKKWQVYLGSFLLLLGIVMLPNIPLYAAETVQVSYDGGEVAYKKEQVCVAFDDTDIDITETPGLILNDTYMVPYEEIFARGLKAACSYDAESNKITITQLGTKIVMQVGELGAYVNHNPVTMPCAPKKVTYTSTGKTKILVPVQFVATHLGYYYSEKENSSTLVTAKITSPLLLYYDGNTHIYHNDKVKVSYNGTKIPLTDMPGIVLENNNMLPIEEVFTGEPIKANYSYEKETGKVTLIRGTHEIILTVGEKTAKVNGNLKTMNVATKLVLNENNNTEYIMAPAKFLFEQLGCTYQWNSAAKIVEVTKSRGTYFTWNTKPTNITDENYVSTVSTKYSKKRDIITIACRENADISVTSSKKYIYVTLKNTIANGKFGEELVDGYLVSKVSMSTSGTTTKLTIKKKSGKPFIYQQGKKKIVIYVGVKPIKIAVDCGHGAKTAGKRTPPMPCDIDFDGDGIIDVKKGQSIKEHQGNVGVGKYLAKELERCGFQVYRSAFGSTDVSLSKRQSNIKKFGSDYSISVHFNAVGNGKKFNSASGIEVLYHRTSSYARKSKPFAKAIIKEMLKGTSQINRGVKSQMLALCNAKTMHTKASILVECAFMTNLREAKTMLGNSKYWEETAKEIAKGVCNYTGVTYIEE